MTDQKPVTVLVGGCFDILHAGHVRFLTEARAQGDRLIVALESDENVRRMKGPSRPIHTQSVRAETLRSLRAVDEVLLLPPMDTDKAYADFVSDIRPSIIAITQGDPVEEKKRSYAKEIGANVYVIPKLATPSTSQLADMIGLE